MMGPIKTYEKLKKQSEKETSISSDLIQIFIGSATCEHAAGSLEVKEEFIKHIKASQRKDIVIRTVGCTGRCSLEPIISIVAPNKSRVTYQKVTKEAAHEIFMSHVMGGNVEKKYLLDACKLRKSSIKEEAKLKLQEHPMMHEFFKVFGNVPFYCDQTRIALRNIGLVDPENLFEYVFYQGFSSLAKILEENTPEKIIDEVLVSKLRGRGGAGFLTGQKWKIARDNEEKERYVICNADEGDPGAFMDRSMLESDPFSVIEGLLIAGFAIGAQKGFFYIRAEYPLSIERVQKALEVCRKHQLLGNNILGSSFSFDIEIRLGAGAFVCGEETALIHSIEGQRGQPRVRPPFPAKVGLFGKPTVINNVETLANLPALLALGGKKFLEIGTEKSGGTKVFAVTGKVTHTGLVEVPLGTTLRSVVMDICGGVPNGKKLKAIQTGGPAGGAIPESLLDTPIDYEELSTLGSIMGSGGLIVLDEDDCMVSVAKFFISFTQDESCGKCTPCREGTTRLLEIFERITNGSGEIGDLEKLERLSFLLQKASLCGLGRGAPNPILNALRFFKDEFISHIENKKCPSHGCTSMIHYEVNPSKCVGCTMCARNCPVECISGERKKVHFIDQNRCIKCGKCFEVCRFDAIIRE